MSLTTEVKTKLVVEEALELITGERQAQYSHPVDNLSDIAEAWSVYLRRRLHTKFDVLATDVAALMILLKVIRQARGYNRDSTVDICGYAELMEVFNEAHAERRFNELSNISKKFATELDTTLDR